MNQHDNYYEKYLKYKNRYLNLNGKKILCDPNYNFPGGFNNNPSKITYQQNKYKIIFIHKIQKKIENDFLYIPLIYVSLKCNIYYKNDNIYIKFKELINNILLNINNDKLTIKKLLKNIKKNANKNNIYGYDSTINDGLFHIPYEIQKKIIFYKKSDIILTFIDKLKKNIYEQTNGYFIYYKKIKQVGKNIDLNYFNISNNQIHGLTINKTDIIKYNEKYNMIAFDNKTIYNNLETDFLIINSYYKKNKCLILFGYLNDNEFNTINGFLDFPGYIIVFRDKNNTWYSKNILIFEIIIKSFISKNNINEITFFGSSMGGYAAIYMAIKIKNSLCIALSPQIFNNINNKNLFFANETVLVEHTSHIIFDLHSLYDNYYKDSNSIIYIIIGRNECNEYKINKSKNKMFMDGLHSGVLFGKKNINLIITNRSFHSIFRGLKKDKISNMINLYHSELMKINGQIVVDNIEYYDVIKKIDE